MPTYKNNTSNSISVSGRSGVITFAPNQESQVDFFIPDEDGLTLVSVSPRVVPQVLVSETIELFNGIDTTINIPKCNAFMVTVICKRGSFTIQESYDDSTVKIVVDMLNAFSAAFKRYDVESLIFEGTGDDAAGESIATVMVSRMA
jgi:hypothetical protein